MTAYNAIKTSCNAIIAFVKCKKVCDWPTTPLFLQLQQHYFIQLNIASIKIIVMSIIYITFNTLIKRIYKFSEQNNVIKHENFKLKSNLYSKVFNISKLTIPIVERCY